MRINRLFAAVLAVLSASTWAQNIPDAGALMRQTEQMMRQNQMQRSSQMREALPPAMVMTESTVLTVQAFKFSGNKLFTSEQLQSVVAAYANRPLNPRDLQHLTDAVSAAYRQTGWLVQAYIPRQDLTNGELTVQVIESIPPNKSLR
jgi:hemolysin activation/secretion protein